MKCLKPSEPCRFRIGNTCELAFIVPQATNPCKETTRMKVKLKRGSVSVTMPVRAYCGEPAGEYCLHCGGDMVTNPCAHVTYCPRCCRVPPPTNVARAALDVECKEGGVK